MAGGTGLGPAGGQVGIEKQGLAQGDGVLRQRPAQMRTHDVVAGRAFGDLEAPIDRLEPLGFVLRGLLSRLAERLALRDELRLLREELARIQREDRGADVAVDERSGRLARRQRSL